MSNTTPIPANKTEIIVATALAGEMLGLKMIYLEAGSGAKNKLQSEIIQNVKNAISIPLIIGGGIKTKEDLREAYTAGADLVVVGTIVEQNPNILLEFGQR
jgi:putative glycerol-1-phosphate prenyltransferase